MNQFRKASRDVSNQEKKFSCGEISRERAKASTIYIALVSPLQILQPASLLDAKETSLAHHREKWDLTVIVGDKNGLFIFTGFVWLNSFAK
jgi:hypothetical protein